MPKAMIWSLIGAFINVTVLSRVGQWLLKKRISNDYRRAFLVFGIVALIDFARLWFLYDDILVALHTMLFYFLPFLVMWLLKDILDASRKRRNKTVERAE